MKSSYNYHNPIFAHLYNGIASAYIKHHEFEKAENFFRKNIEIRLFQLNTMFSFLSESEKEKFWKTFRTDFDEFNTIASIRYKENPAIVSEVYDNLLITKGFLFNSSVKLRSEILFGNNETLIKKYKIWIEHKEQLGTLYQQSNAKILTKNISIDSLELSLNQIEKELSRNSQLFNQKQLENKTTWKDVQLALKPNEAAIEFHSYKYNPEKENDSVVYIALLIRPDYKYPKLINLCNEQELNTAIQNSLFLVNNSYVYVNSYIADSGASRQLYKLIWEPIDNLLKGSDQIYISLSGLTHKISFNAITDINGKFLLNKYNIRCLNSTRSLVSTNHLKEHKPTSAAIFGGIKYDVLMSELLQNVKKYKSNQTFELRGIIEDSLKENMWNYLPGTLDEALTIDNILTSKKLSTTSYIGSSAIEEVVKNFNGNNSPNILHIATHGYFFKDPGYSDTDIPSGGINIFENSPNPLYRSGLVLAGGNRVWQGGKPIDGIDDGILTAYEVANLDLRGTQIAVLSACETGLGDVKSGEGVYGLQRAFQLAGVKSIIMSLWQIPDKESMELMELFYTNYLSSGDKYNSLRNAQLELAKKYPPYFWSAFVLVE